MARATSDTMMTAVVAQCGMREKTRGAVAGGAEGGLGVVLVYA